MKALLLAATASAIALTFTVDARADRDQLPAHCAVSLPNLGEVPANAPVIPVLDGSEGLTPSLSLSTPEGAVPTTQIPRFFLAHLDAPPAKGGLTLNWTLGCSSGTAPQTGQWQVAIGKSSPLPSGEIGGASNGGPISSIFVSPASRAFGRLSAFTVRSPDYTAPPVYVFYNEVAAHSGGRAGGAVERIDVGYAETFRPSEGRPGVLDLTIPISSASKSVCHGAATGTESADITVEQRLIGQNEIAAQTTTTVTVDCAKADEAERAIQVVSVDDGCNAAGGRGRDGTWLGFIAFALFAFRRGRGRGRGVRA